MATIDRCMLCGGDVRCTFGPHFCPGTTFARNARFWMIWCPTGGIPTMKHPSAGVAKAEAARLAKVHPGKTFIVLEAIAAVTVSDLVWTTLD
jgi:hypothetical protein